MFLFDFIKAMFCNELIPYSVPTEKRLKKLMKRGIMNLYNAVHKEGKDCWEIPIIGGDYPIRIQDFEAAARFSVGPCTNDIEENTWDRLYKELINELFIMNEV